ncbi:MAG TPA: PQQ-dependent sugar dehydrogenase [Labilithrix sp.]|nr:PQQ-dependent sugar dehydrogenase [Labilithrix sp.]
MACAALAACGGDDAASKSSGPGQDGGPDGAPPPPVERKPFPLTTPSLGGYGLVDVFGPNVSLTIPSAVVWPKVEGALPFVLERTGTVVQIEAGKTRVVLDISQNVALMSEGGALGMALHPMFGDGTGPSPYVYLWYNAQGTPKNKQRLSRFAWDAASKSFDGDAELVLIEEEEEQPEHNAGRLQFGPDGFLYFGNGDDTRDANHQRIDRALFAGIFRIDVDARGGAISHAPPRGPEGGYSGGYFIPNDNPFVGAPNALEEFYAVGFRNPFGFSFDRKTGALWVGDVGDTWREEIDQVVPGGNYEWPYREGDVTREAKTPTIGTARAPVYSYTHAEMGDLAAILGGFVYRGEELPELAGKYIYSDWPSNRVWALDLATNPKARTTLIDNQWNRMPMALAEDNRGEIYLLHSDGILKLARDASRDALPKRLSETMLFKNVAALETEPGLVPYEINSPLWSDAAAKRRWISVPPGQRVELADDGTLKFPVGTTFVKHFELPASVTPRARTRRLETRVLVVGNDTSYGLTYRWNAEGTDAELLSEGVDEPIHDEAAGQTRSWHYPSFGQCWSCHRAENRVLGFTAQQLHRVVDGKPQVDALVARGVFDPGASAKWPVGLASPSDAAASLEERATAYLAANCSSCHHEGASFLGGGDTWRASPGVPLADRGLIGQPHHNTPMAEKLGLVDAPLIDPGNPDGSILMARIKTNDPDLRMPPLARNVVDADGARIIEEWIRAMPKD